MMWLTCCPEALMAASNVADMLSEALKATSDVADMLS